MLLSRHEEKCSDSASIGQGKIFLPKKRGRETFAHSSQDFFFLKGVFSQDDGYHAVTDLLKATKSTDDLFLFRRTTLTICSTSSDFKIQEFHVVVTNFAKYISLSLQ